MVGPDAAPAALPRKQGLGRPRDPPGRHYDRPARSSLGWDWPKAGNARQGLVPGSADLGTYVRRPKGRRGDAAMEPPAGAGLFAKRLVAVTGDHQDVAPPGAPSPSAWPREREERAHPAPTQEQGVRSVGYAGCLKIEAGTIPNPSP